MRQPKVAYFYDPDIGGYYYGPGHPMKPQRIRMTHSLIMGYDLYKHLEVYRPHDAEPAELLAFHDSDYISFLAKVTPETFKSMSPAGRQFNLEVGTDCPVFEGLFDFQSSCAGASIDAARQLNHRLCDIAINWSGGLHHAKRAEASGFCYFNDAVLGIIELLKFHSRVLYIDIDVHHGDGVEEAFFLSHRVMTVSFHKYGNFFPGTGGLKDIGAGPGKYYAVNVPLNDGLDDTTFLALFKRVIPKAIEMFRPEAILLQCGADSLTGDRLGTFNLSTRGHGACAQYIKSLRIPLMLVGGGGYVVRNVARAWLFETAIALGHEADISERIPVNEYSEYFAPDHKLHLVPDANIINQNSQTYIDSLVGSIFNHLKHLEHSPSVEFAHVPADFFKPIIDDQDPDEFNQYSVDWEGGGLACESPRLWEPPSPFKIKRAYDPREADDDQNDRDLKRPLDILGIPASPHRLSKVPNSTEGCGHDKAFFSHQLHANDRTQ